MRIAGSIITAICGIVIIVSIFLPWYSYFGFGTSNAWDGISTSISDAMDVFLVFMGGIVMTVFAIPAFIVSIAAKGGKAAVVTLSIFSIVGALLAIGGSVWFIIDTVLDSFLDQMGIGAFDVISYGVWIAIAAAVVGFIFAILTAAFSKGKQDW